MKIATVPTIQTTYDFLRVQHAERARKWARQARVKPFIDLNLVDDAECINLTGAISSLYRQIISSIEQIKRLDSTPKTQALLSEAMTLATNILENKVKLDQVTDFVNNKLPPHFGDNKNKNHLVALSILMCVLAGIMLILAPALPVVLIASGVGGAGLAVIAMMTGYIVGLLAMKVSIDTLNVSKQKDFIESDGLKNNLNGLFAVKTKLDKRIPVENQEAAYKLLGYRS